MKGHHDPLIDIIAPNPRHPDIPDVFRSVVESQPCEGFGYVRVSRMFASLFQTATLPTRRWLRHVSGLV
jgi:hypothetical protein